MSNRKRLSKNRHAFQNLLRGLKHGRTLEPARLEAVERMERHFDALLHALDTSNSRDAKLQLALVAKEACNAFLVDGKLDEV
jgi:hypothetical protein